MVKDSGRQVDFRTAWHGLSSERTACATRWQPEPEPDTWVQCSLHAFTVQGTHCSALIRRPCSAYCANGSLSMALASGAFFNWKGTTLHFVLLFKPATPRKPIAVAASSHFVRYLLWHRRNAMAAALAALMIPVHRDFRRLLKTNPPGKERPLAQHFFGPSYLLQSPYEKIATSHRRVTPCDAPACHSPARNHLHRGCYVIQGPSPNRKQEGSCTSLCLDPTKCLHLTPESLIYTLPTPVRLRLPVSAPAPCFLYLSSMRSVQGISDETRL